jgi:hypothetical protein
MALRGTAHAVSRFLGSSTQKEGRDPGFIERDGSAVDAPQRRSLARGDLVPESGLIELGSDSELTVHATVSTREITLVGPATAEACPGGDEAMRLAYGRVTAFPGSGVRPGAEVWIATPLGVVRFSDAKIDIGVPDTDAARLEIAVITGQATFMPALGIAAAAPGAVAPPEGDKNGLPAGALEAGEAIPLLPGSTLAVRRREGPVSRWASGLVAACVRQAAAARQAAELVAAPRDAGRGLLADLAFAHVKARQHARAACEMAWAAGGLAPGLDAARRADLESADATWKGAPAPSGAYQLTPLPARR